MRLVAAIVWDTAVDYWSFGIMALEKFSLNYARSEFRVVGMVAEVKESMRKGPDATLKALNRF